MYLSMNSLFSSGLILGKFVIVGSGFAFYHFSIVINKVVCKLTWPNILCLILASPSISMAKSFMSIKLPF